METKQYLIKSEYDFNNKKFNAVNDCELTIQFKIMDSCCLVERIRYKWRVLFKTNFNKEFLHVLLSYVFCSDVGCDCVQIFLAILLLPVNRLLLGWPYCIDLKMILYLLVIPKQIFAQFRLIWIKSYIPNDVK